MRRFKNILFVKEAGTASSSTPAAVVELARANQARLTLCDVVQPMPRSFVQLAAKMRGLRQQQLTDLVRDLGTQGLDVQTKLLEGSPFVEVIRELRRSKHDLVIKNAEVSSITDNAFGANDMHHMRKCPCPLRIARSDNLGPYRSLVAAIDADLVVMDTVS